MMIIIIILVAAVHSSAASDEPTGMMLNFDEFGGLPDFKLLGGSLLFGLWSYSSTVHIGNPTKMFRMVIDTGSDINWISCTPNEKNDLLAIYDVKKSTTGSTVLCGDPMCPLLNNSNNCRSLNEPCPFSVTYQDETAASGYYVSDVLYFNTTGDNSTSGNSSTRFVFGCATETKGFEYTEGLLGLSPSRASMILQLHSQEKSPLVFSHCLTGALDNGGYLVFGQPKVPNIVFTPFIPFQPNYYVNIEGISVGGKALPVPSEAFSFSRGQGTIVDSGTSVATLVAEAFDPLIAEISKIKNLFPAPWSDGHNYCYVKKEVASLDIFPIIDMKFAGGVSMLLHPDEYLIEDGAGLMCVGFGRCEGLNVLGDTVLKDKIIVYDLSSQRIGWSDHCNCSVHPNMTFSYKQGNYSSGTNGLVNKAALLPALVAVILVHLLVVHT